MSWNDAPDYTPQTDWRSALLVALIVVVAIVAAVRDRQADAARARESATPAITAPPAGPVLQ